MRRQILLRCCSATLATILCTNLATATKIWESTFDSTADGVVDLFNNDLGKVMIGPAAGGNLQITAWDNSTNAFTPDKAGRPLGSTLSGNSTMSAQYKFKWSTLNPSETQAYEEVGFLGNSSPQTRQVLGGILRHWKITGTNDNYVALDIAAGGAGITNFGYASGAPFYLGTNPTANDYELRIEYDGASHVLSLSLLDALGATLTSNSKDLDTDVPGLQPTPAAELGSMALTHLGWSDYTGNGGDRATVWQVNSLAYYDTARVPVPEPTSVVLVMMSLLAVVGRRRTRKE
jgi:hypothetical protein